MNVVISCGSRNFKTWGRGPGAVEILGLEFVLMLLHTGTTLSLCSRLVNKIQIVMLNIACWLKSKYMLLYSQSYKSKPPKFLKPGGGGRTLGAPVLDPYMIKYKINLFFNPRKSIYQYE